MFFVVFREDHFLDDARQRLSLRSDALSLRARARLRKTPKNWVRFRGLKNTRKNMCFLYLYLFLTTKRHNARLSWMCAPTTPGRGGVSRATVLKASWLCVLFAVAVPTTGRRAIADATKVVQTCGGSNVRKKRKARRRRARPVP